MSTILTCDADRVSGKQYSVFARIRDLMSLFFHCWYGAVRPIYQSNGVMKDCGIDYFPYQDTPYSAIPKEWTRLPPS
jgi:hypothetical protein